MLSTRSGTATVILAIGGAVTVGQVSPPPPPPPCFANSTQNCSDVHYLVNKNRTCSFGSLSILCGDVVLQDGAVTDHRLAASNEAGFRLWGFGDWIPITVEQFECGATEEEGCNYLGANQLQCQGRPVDEDSDDCTGTGPTPRPN